MRAGSTLLLILTWFAAAPAFAAGNGEPLTAPPLLRGAAQDVAATPVPAPKAKNRRLQHPSSGSPATPAATSNRSPSTASDTESYGEPSVRSHDAAPIDDSGDLSWGSDSEAPAVAAPMRVDFLRRSSAPSPPPNQISAATQRNGPFSQIGRTSYPLPKVDTRQAMNGAARIVRPVARSGKTKFPIVAFSWAAIGVFAFVLGRHFLRTMRRKRVAAAL